MESAKHCAVIVRRSEDVWEGTRTSLALAAHNHYVSLYVVDCQLDAAVFAQVEADVGHAVEWIGIGSGNCEGLRCECVRIVRFVKQTHQTVHLLNVIFTRCSIPVTIVQLFNRKVVDHCHD